MQKAQVEITFSEAIRRYFTRSAQFTGRATRAEYWYVYLFNLCVLFPLAFFSGLAHGLHAHEVGTALGILYGVYCLGTFLSGWTLFVRRLHDSGHSGWWIAVFFGIPSLVFLFFDSQHGRNEYGDSEKYPEAEEPSAVFAGTPTAGTPPYPAPVRQTGTSKPAGTQRPAKCLFCGGDLRGATSFCPHCGAKVLK